MTAETIQDDGAEILIRAFQAEVPVVGVLGQSAGWSVEHPDPLVKLALSHAQKSGTTWKALLSREPLQADFYEWLSERFVRRAPSEGLELIGDAPLSAVFTSSIDPNWVNLFATKGREPEPVLLGNPGPPVLRSRRRPPIYYLFGRAGLGTSDMRPPLTVPALSQRRLQHAAAMLRNITETATVLGLIIIDGFEPASDWLKAEDLLAMLASAPSKGVLWLGPEPQLETDDAESYKALVERGVVLRDQRSLSHLMAILAGSGALSNLERWDEPEVVTLPEQKKLVTTPQLRLATQASALILDDSFTGFLPPLSAEMERAAFYAFHGASSGTRTMLEGIRRGFAVERAFEGPLRARVERALAQHHSQKGATIVHGQSGVGKTVALARLAISVREKRTAAVLFASGRIPQATEISDFLAAVDRVGGLTLLIVDATIQTQRYDDLLRALRSRGHRVVVVGTSYRVEPSQQFERSRYVEAPASLDSRERTDLIRLVENFAPEAAARVSAGAVEPHALARFYWDLPPSRIRLSEGLGREVRAVESTIRTRGAQPRPIAKLGAVGEALIEAGYATHPLMEANEPALSSPHADTAASRLIDYVMAASRLYRWVPINLVLRAVLSQAVDDNHLLRLDIIRDLFEGQDLFRWKFAEENGEELLVGARLQIEAELICNRILGGPTGEATRIIDLIKCAYKAGSEESEETKFLAEVVYALGPDGPFRERYRDAYDQIARALTELRERHGVFNARLMLQESTLRRAFIRTHDLVPNERARLLDEASRAVDEALQALDRTSGRRLYASRRTRANLWVERAATYGFLATDSAQRGASPSEIWSSYRAAREAVRMATGRVDTYFPLDIGLWLPAQVLREAPHLDEIQRRELEADLRSTLELVDPATLDPDQFEKFQRQRISLSGVLNDKPLAHDALEALKAAGSTAGYFLEARSLAPKRPDEGDIASDQDVEAAKRTTSYLWSVYQIISSDPRCLHLLLSNEWLSQTGRWLFRGLRQPLPARDEDRVRIRNLLLDLTAASPEALQPKYRYLEAVLNWLTNDAVGSRATWNALARETEYIESGRVLNRHVITDDLGQVRFFDGLVERQLGERRWSVLVESLSRRVDLAEADFPRVEIAIGRSIRAFAISFNYLGPIADPYARRQQ